MNIFAFVLITVVAVIIKNELLTLALIIWGLALLGRHIWQLRPANDRKMGRNTSPY